MTGHIRWITAVPVLLILWFSTLTTNAQNRTPGSATEISSQPPVDGQQLIGFDHSTGLEKLSSSRPDGSTLLASLGVSSAQLQNMFNQFFSGSTSGSNPLQTLMNLFGQGRAGSGGLQSPLSNLLNQFLSAQGVSGSGGNGEIPFAGLQAISPKGDKIYVVNAYTGALSVIDNPQSGQPGGIAADDAGSMVGEDFDSFVSDAERVLSEDGAEGSDFSFGELKSHTNLDGDEPDDPNTLKSAKDRREKDETTTDPQAN